MAASLEAVTGGGFSAVRKPSQVILDQITKFSYANEQTYIFE